MTVLDVRVYNYTYKVSLWITTAIMNMSKQAIKPIAKEIIRSTWIPNGDRRNSVQIGLQSSVPFSSKKKPSEHSRLLLYEVWFTWIPMVWRSDADVVVPKSDVDVVPLSRSNGR